MGHRRTIGVLALALALILCRHTIAHAAEGCVVQVRHHFSEAAKERWRKESIEQPIRYRREQRYLRTKRLLDILCGSLPVETMYTDALLEEEPRIDLALAWEPVQIGDTERERGKDTASEVQCDCGGGDGNGVANNFGWFGGGGGSLIGISAGFGGSPSGSGSQGSQPGGVSGNGQGTGAQVPEPASLALLALGMAPVLRRILCSR